MCLFLCIFPFHSELFHIFHRAAAEEIKIIFFEKDFSLRTGASECAWCEKKFCCVRHVPDWNGTFRGAMYVRAGEHQHRRDERARQPKQKAREKRNNTKCCIRSSWAVDCSRNIRLCTLCDSEKTLFINIVLRYISRGRQSLYALSLSLARFFFHFFFPSSSPLYRIKWWIFACPRRLFQKHSAPPRALALASKQQRSALVLGYYYFLVFLAFVAPKKRGKIIYTESTTTTTTTTMANGLWFWLCVASELDRRMHTPSPARSQRFFLLLETEKAMNWNCYVSTISGYYFYYTNFSSIASSSWRVPRLVSIFYFFLVRHNHNSEASEVERGECIHHQMPFDDVDAPADGWENGDEKSRKQEGWAAEARIISQPSAIACSVPINFTAS